MTADRSPVVRALFLALRPGFAEAVVKRQKRFELRRTRPTGAHVGMPVVLYATSPVSEIVGICRVGGLLEGSRNAVWEAVGPQASLSRREFDRYFKGSSRVVALRLTAAVRAGEPVSLEQIREVWAGFHPPRAFRYVDMEGLNGQATPFLNVVKIAGRLPRLRVL